MKLHDLHTAEGSTKKRKRVGRGDSSGYGRTAGRGEKGQKSRTGSVIRPHFEGGQIPLFRRLPKRGFTSRNHKDYNIVNVSVLEEICKADETVTLESLRAQGVIGKNSLPLKVLGNGEISKSLTVQADKFSKAAMEKIEKAGGKCEQV